MPHCRNRCATCAQLHDETLLAVDVAPVDYSDMGFGPLQEDGFSHIEQHTTL